jgi:hypothetical protein
VGPGRPAAASDPALCGLDNPDFKTKTADIMGFYLNPPRHAAVFAFDEKSAI